MATFKKLVAVYMSAKTQNELDYAFTDIQQKLIEDLGDNFADRCDLKSGAEQVIRDLGGHVRNLEGEDYIKNRQNYV